MIRGHFLRSLLGVAVTTPARILRKASGPELAETPRKTVLALSSADDQILRIPDRRREYPNRNGNETADDQILRIPDRRRPSTTPPSELRWSHDDDGHWYVENTRTGTVTRL